uniref:Uncharacterized protein n=1 Tax=Nicotiana tabacum TaxID=4097 RepID=A0A1S3WXN0_TOBAC|nr:PREDICTED: uncharacterized protein LOC107759025 [Nicotiana tabacum]
MEESTNELLKKLLIDNQQLRTDFTNLERQMGNGRELEEVPKKRKDKPIPEGELIPKVTNEPEKTAEIPKQVEAPRPPPPFPQRLQKKNDDRMFSKFLSMLIQYIKDIVAHKRRLTEFETVALTEECTSKVQNKLPQNLKDPGSFTIPVRIGNIDLADRSISHPEGVIGDVLLQIGKFIFPTDFIILDYEADELVPIILGRPLLATGDAIIKVREGKMILRVDDEEAVFNVYKAIQLPSHYEELSMISVVEVDEQIRDAIVYLDDSLEKALMLFDSLGIEEEVEEMMHILDTSCAYMQGTHPFEPLNRPEGPPPKPSIEKAPKFELKPLPSHLQYAYLGDSDTLPIIVSSDFSQLQEEKLLRVLRKHKHALGWTMYNIKGISPAFCIHKILMEEGKNPSVKQQRRHNPMKEVVRKEVIKWLDASIVFPISESKWVDKAKVEGIEKLPPPISAFEELKERLVTAPIIIAPDWEQPFELMCDASDLAIGAVLGQRRNKIFHSIYYASKTLNLDQMNYTVTEKELLQWYGRLTNSNHILWGPKSSSTQIIQPSDTYIRDRRGTENQVAGHLFRLENRNHVAEGGVITETFPDEQLLAITSGTTPWYADYVNFIASGVTPPELTPDNRRRFLHDVRLYMWDEPFLYRLYADQLVRRCVLEEEISSILHSCHASPYRGHHGGDRTTQKVLQSGFYWPKLFKDAHAFVKMCDRCQRTGTITKKHEMPL